MPALITQAHYPLGVSILTALSLRLWLTVVDVMRGKTIGASALNRTPNAHNASGAPMPTLRSVTDQLPDRFKQFGQSTSSDDVFIRCVQVMQLGGHRFGYQRDLLAFRAGLR